MTLPLSKKREQGMPGARCTRGLVCKVAQRKAHTSIQVQRRQSGIPCAMALRLMPCSPRRRIRLVTVVGGLGLIKLGWVDFASARLGTSNGCRDHTVLPYANSAVRLARRLSLTSNSPCDHLARRRCRVHRIPSRVRDDRERPSCRERTGRAGRTDLPDGESEIFFAKGLDRFLSRTDLPVGCLSRTNVAGGQLVKFRYAPIADQIPHPSEMTRCAKRRLHQIGRLRRKADFLAR